MSSAAAELSQLPTNQEWATRCTADGEFRLAARHYTGGLRLNIGDRRLELSVHDGVPGDAALPVEAPWLEFGGTDELWQKMLAAVPPRFHNDTAAAASHAVGLTRRGDSLLHSQYYGAFMRAIELLRPPSKTARAEPPRPLGSFDAPVGRYVHVTLQGEDHRLYFEEAGQGIPILLQHTAGCHGSQWRHLFENSKITDRFRLIAYDLPYHGKSLPPTGASWWAQKYDLTGEFLRAIPLQLSQALGLDRPVFMGCSVGGLLALDLALHEPDAFRAVISVEGALNIEGSMEALGDLWHPQISNDYKARLMEGLMSPTSPAAYVKETSFVYAAGWPQAFIGDLFYYVADFDLRARAGEIDTNRVGVHILSGEYDHSGTVELGQAAHAAIAGSTWSEMPGVGHFPMSENPTVFMEYLQPILAKIA